MSDALLARMPARRLAPLIALLLAACAVGPDYQAPAAPAAERYVRQDPQAAALPVPQADAQFWRELGDPLLESLVDDALRANHDVRIALARYEQARALLRETGMDRYPTLSASGQLSDVRNSASQMPGATRAERDTELHGASLSAVWELDFFGRVRRAVEAQRAEVQASEADLAGMQVAIVAELADAYFRLRGLQAQLAVARENAANQADTLRLIDALVQNGRGTAFDADRARTQWELTQARIPPLQAEAAATAHRIAVLTGRTPQALAQVLDQAAPLPEVAAQVNAGAPGELLRRRPDIAAAERRLHAATARIGVATADLFPRFTLGGLIGTQALGLGALFERDSETRMISLGVGGSFLDVGRVRARIAAANSAAAADLAAYEQTVLRAMEETENALERLARAQTENASLLQAAQASRRAARTARVQFDGGVISVLDVLSAERARLEAEDLLARSAARRATALVAVYRALAGGWPQALPEPQGAALARR
ncbi:efflux transporter outer membrane subunit [Orrella sp. JC864]|uniref:efflux transporter outer membrane subunit n=1 Tax=Orrella sp. JC864 TaxID=3120298 RepID=UPI003009047D